MTNTCPSCNVPFGEHLGLVFGGGEAMSVCLSNRNVKARKQHRCDHCFEPILKGEIYVSRSGVEPGEGYWRYNAHTECDKATEHWRRWDWELSIGVRHKRGTEEEA